MDFTFRKIEDETLLGVCAVVQIFFRVVMMLPLASSGASQNSENRDRFGEDHVRRANPKTILRTTAYLR